MLSRPAHMGLIMTRDNNDMQGMSSACIARGGPAVKGFAEEQLQIPALQQRELSSQQCNQAQIS